MKVEAVKRLQHRQTEMKPEVTTPDKTLLHEGKELQMKEVIDDNQL